MNTNFSQSDAFPAKYYRTLISAIPNGVLVLFDDELRYRIVGPDILPFSKREAADMVGKTIHELFPKAAADNLEPELRATLDGSPRSFDMDYGDRIHHIETNPVTIDGNPCGVLVTQDVTAERETTEQLADKTQRLETVASVLAHDLRNSMTIAMGNLEIIEDEVTANRDSLAKIRKALLRMDTIMADALVLARETTLSDVEEVDIQRHVEATWQLVSTEGAKLETDESVRVEADPGLLRNLFENLIHNAVSHGGPTVTVRVGVLDDGEGFYVEDDGPGVDPAIQDTVFEGGVTTQSEENHSGLGLAIVKAIVDAHEWDVTVTKAASGGARFEITGLKPIS